MAAVPAGTVDHRAGEAHLRAAGPAVLADPASVVWVVHEPPADPGRLLADAGAPRGHDAARLVPDDHARLALDAAGHRPRRPRGGAVVVQVAATHARGLDLDDRVSG